MNAPYTKPPLASSASYKTFLDTQPQAQHHVTLFTIQIFKPLHCITLAHSRPPPPIISHCLLTTNVLISLPTSQTLQSLLFDTPCHRATDSRKAESTGWDRCPPLGSSHRTLSLPLNLRQEPLQHRDNSNTSTALPAFLPHRPRRVNSTT